MTTQLESFNIMIDHLNECGVNSKLIKKYEELKLGFDKAFNILIWIIDCFENEIISEDHFENGEAGFMLYPDSISVYYLTDENDDGDFLNRFERKYPFNTSVDQIIEDIKNSPEYKEEYHL